MAHPILRYLFPAVLALIAVAVPAAAQVAAPVIEARLSADSIGIGDHFSLEVTVEKDMMQVVAFPDFREGNFTDAVEILEEGAADTLSREGRTVRLSKRYKLTTFEEGVHEMGRYPVLYLDKNIIDTLWSREALSLTVGTFQIDTTKQTIRDIKRPMDAPLKAGEISGWIAAGLGALLLVALIVWLIVRHRRNLTLFGRPKHVDPPHVAAIRALEILHNQKLWQNNKHKIYYTRLTDILREYIDGRYGVPAMEMTSDEILSALTGSRVPERSLDALAGILRTADFVKFAQMSPPAEENEDHYTEAFYFVEETKPDEIEDPVDPDAPDAPGDPDAEQTRER